jgi:hypothetical protein
MALFPAPTEGIALTHFIVSRDVERSRRFYTEVLGGEAVLEGELSIVALANGWVTISVAGGPTCNVCMWPESMRTAGPCLLTRCLPARPRSATSPESRGFHTPQCRSTSPFSARQGLSSAAGPADTSCTGLIQAPFARSTTGRVTMNDSGDVDSVA